MVSSDDEQNSSQFLYSTMAKNILDELDKEEMNLCIPPVEKSQIKDRSKLDDIDKSEVSNDDSLSESFDCDSVGTDDILESKRRIQARFQQSPFAKIVPEILPDKSQEENAIEVLSSNSNEVIRSSMASIILNGPFGSTTVTFDKKISTIELIKMATYQLKIPFDQKLCLLKNDLVIMDNKPVSELDFESMQIVHYNTIKLEKVKVDENNCHENQIFLKFNIGHCETSVDKIVEKTAQFESIVKEICMNQKNIADDWSKKEILVVYNGEVLPLNEPVNTLGLSSGTCLDLYFT
ncbi:MAG: hypothetical protein MHMPM18_000702 [Marteilia pararefringens]